MLSNLNRVCRFSAKLIIAAGIGLALAPTVAFAQSITSPVETVLQWVVDSLTGAVATSMGIITLCFIGYRFAAGLMHWGAVMGWVIGIVFMFGGAHIVSQFRGLIGQ